MKREASQQAAFGKPTVAISALAAAISACYTTGAVAAADNEVRQIEEIVVSVRRRVEMAQDVPISMTVMTEDFLRNNSIEKVEDLGTKVPSLRITQSGGSLNEPVITLRGQRQGEASFNQDPAAPIYFNEIVIAPIHGGNLGLYDLEGLQVLKGPQGTLFGRNSTGGAVVITPKRPGSELGGYAEFEVGDYSLYSFEGAVDVPIGDNLQTRLSGRKLDRDGYQKNIADNELNGRRYRDEHSENVRLSINFDNGSLNNLTVLGYDVNRMAAAVPVTTAVNYSVGLGASANPRIGQWKAAVEENAARNDPWKVKSDIDSEENVKNVFASNTTEVELNDELTLKNVFGYRQVYLESASDIDGTALPLFGAYPTAAPGWVVDGLAPATWNPRLNSVDTEFYSDELQLLGSAFDDRLDWITGLYWSKLTGTEDRLLQQGPFSYDVNLNDIRNTTYGLFLEGTATLTDRWSITAGARQSWEKREITVRRWSDLARMNCGIFAPGEAPPGGARAANCARTEDASFSSPTWRVSANYTPAESVLMYASVSTGFRAGGFNTRGVDDATLQPFDEESVVTYELGHKADWDLAGIAARSSLALYFQTYEDIQNTVSFYEGTRLVTRTENAAKAEISGLELELTLMPTDDLTLNMSYSWVDAKFKERNTLIAGAAVDTSNGDFTYIPEQSLTASATYRLPLDPAVGDVSLVGGVYWQDTMSTHPYVKQFGLYGWSDADVAAMTRFSEADAYAVWNFRVDWRSVMGSAFDVAAYVNNATDEEYVLGGLNVVESGGYGAYHYGAPRTIGASVRYTF